MNITSTVRLLACLLLMLMLSACAKKTPLARKPPPVISPICSGLECISFKGNSDDACPSYPEIPRGGVNKSITAYPSKSTHAIPIYLVWKLEKLNPDATINSTTDVQVTAVSNETKLNCLYERVGNVVLRHRLLPLCASNDLQSVPSSCTDMKKTDEFPSGYSPTAMKYNEPVMVATLEGDINFFSKSETVSVSDAGATANPIAQAGIVATNVVSDCEISCTNFDQKCVSRRANDISMSSIQSLISLVRNLSGTPTISMKSVHSIFGIEEKDDPCVRGDTLFLNSTLRNQGNHCEILAEISNGNNIEKISLLVPDEIKGNYDLRANGMDVTFMDEKLSPDLHFSSPGLNSVLGGNLKRITVSDNKLFISTNQSCLRISP